MDLTELNKKDLKNQLDEEIQNMDSELNKKIINLPIDESSKNSRYIIRYSRCYSRRLILK